MTLPRCGRCEDKDGAAADEDDDLEALRARRRKQMKAHLSCWDPVENGQSLCRPWHTQLFDVIYVYDMIFMICVRGLYDVFVHMYIYICI